MKQRRMVVNIEFFKSQNPKDVERKLKESLPATRTLVVNVDHKNFMYQKNTERKNLDAGVGTDVSLKYKCPKDGREWLGNAIKTGKGILVWSGSDLCPVCGSRGEVI